MKVKICGLFRPQDIEAVNAVKPDFCGFVVNFPKSRRNVSPEMARQLQSSLDPAITPVGVFVDQPLELVAELLESGTISAAQLHGGEDNRYIENLRARTDKAIWQAFQIRSERDVKRALASQADFLLLDGGQGAGKAFDWSLLSGISRPFGLAGGLKLENLSHALETNAVLLDVSGGVETEGYKDAVKIKTFVSAVRNA